MAIPTKPARQLLLIAALLVIGYTWTHTLSFTHDTLNSIFESAVYLIPFFAIHPVLHLGQRLRKWGLILLTPVLLLSLLFLLGVLLRDEHTRPLQTLQLGHSTIELQRYENGGAVGVRGLYLEQRRLILPGLYIVRSIDFFDYAKQGTLSVEGANRVRAHVKGNYDNNEAVVDKAYDLKPWVFF